MSSSPTVYDSTPRPGKKLIFRPWRTDPVTGKRFYAPHFGIRAWPLWVDDDDNVK